MRLHAASCNLCNFMRLHATSCGFMRLHATSCNFMQHHATVLSDSYCTRHTFFHPMSLSPCQPKLRPFISLLRQFNLPNIPPYLTRQFFLIEKCRRKRVNDFESLEDYYRVLASLQDVSLICNCKYWRN